MTKSYSYPCSIKQWHDERARTKSHILLKNNTFCLLDKFDRECTECSMIMHMVFVLCFFLWLYMQLWVLVCDLFSHTLQYCFNDPGSITCSKKSEVTLKDTGKTNQHYTTETKLRTICRHIRGMCIIHTKLLGFMLTDSICFLRTHRAKRSVIAKYKTQFYDMLRNIMDTVIDT